jgi:6-pyruvoyltetrahydropterin/6-carboxytetrahydropterin synthase
MKIGTTMYIDAAHRLPNHPGKCQYIHGHTYKTIVTIWGEPDSKTGMLMDFGIIKELVNEMDHTDLNTDVFVKELPTAEHIAQMLSAEILTEGLKGNSKLTKVQVRVYEGHNNWAEKISEATPTEPGKPPKHLVPLWMVVKSNDGKMTKSNNYKIWIEQSEYGVQLMTDPNIRPLDGKEQVRIRCFKTKEEMQEWRGKA